MREKTSVARKLNVKAGTAALTFHLRLLLSSASDAEEASCSVDLIPTPRSWTAIRGRQERAKRLSSPARVDGLSPYSPSRLLSSPRGAIYSSTFPKGEAWQLFKSPRRRECQNLLKHTRLFRAPSGGWVSNGCRRTPQGPRLHAGCGPFAGEDTSPVMP